MAVSPRGEWLDQLIRRNEREMAELPDSVRKLMAISDPAWVKGQVSDFAASATPAIVEQHSEHLAG